MSGMGAHGLIVVWVGYVGWVVMIEDHDFKEVTHAGSPTCIFWLIITLHTDRKESTPLNHHGFKKEKK